MAKQLRKKIDVEINSSPENREYFTSEGELHLFQYHGYIKVGVDDIKSRRSRVTFKIDHDKVRELLDYLCDVDNDWNGSD